MANQQMASIKNQIKSPYQSTSKPVELGKNSGYTNISKLNPTTATNCSL